MTPPAKATKPAAHTVSAYQAPEAFNPEDFAEAILRQCMAMAPGFTAAVAAAVDERVRAEWGGCRAHISTVVGGHDVAISRRNAAIMADWQRGERVDLLARRYGLTRRRIEQIIAANRITWQG